MRDIILTIGHNVNGIPTHDTAAVCATACDVLGIDGCTAVPCLGVWHGESESSTRLEVCALSEAEAARVWDLIPSLADALKQCEVMAEQRPSRVAFIARAETGSMTA